MHIKVCSVLGILLLAACTTHADGTQSASKTAIGAGVGALAGGVLGNRLDKDKRGRGTVIGAAAGAAAGAGIGYLMDRQEAELREQLASERTDHAIELERVRDDLLKLTMSNEISFDFGSAAIKPAFKPTMYKLAEANPLVAAMFGVLLESPFMAAPYFFIIGLSLRLASVYLGQPASQRGGDPATARA